jgi:hypothetical protein
MSVRPLDCGRTLGRRAGHRPARHHGAAVVRRVHHRAHSVAPVLVGACVMPGPAGPLRMSVMFAPMPRPGGVALGTRSRVPAASGVAVVEFPQSLPLIGPQRVVEVPSDPVRKLVQLRLERLDPGHLIGGEPELLRMVSEGSEGHHRALVVGLSGGRVTGVLPCHTARGSEKQHERDRDRVSPAHRGGDSARGWSITVPARSGSPAVRIRPQYRKATPGVRVGSRESSGTCVGDSPGTCRARRSRE